MKSHYLSYLDHEGLVGQAGALFVRVVRDAAEDDDLLVRLSIRHDSHRVVSNLAELQRVGYVLDLQPRFLVKEEQEHVLEEWVHLAVTLLVVAAACDDEALIARQEAHGVAGSAAWWEALLLDLLPLSVHNLAILDNRLQESQFVAELAFLISASKEVDTF